MSGRRYYPVDRALARLGDLISKAAYGDEHVMFGSGVLYLHGLRAPMTVGDLDVFVSRRLWGTLARMEDKCEIRTPQADDPAFLDFRDPDGSQAIHLFYAWAERDRQWISPEQCFEKPDRLQWGYKDTSGIVRCARLEVILQHKRSTNPRSPRAVADTADMLAIEQRLGLGKMDTAKRREWEAKVMGRWEPPDNALAPGLRAGDRVGVIREIVGAPPVGTPCTVLRDEHEGHVAIQWEDDDHEPQQMMLRTDALGIADLHFEVVNGPTLPDYEVGDRVVFTEDAEGGAGTPWVIKGVEGTVTEVEHGVGMVTVASARGHYRVPVTAVCAVDERGRSDYEAFGG